jgi:hypothetical protein
MLRKLIVIIVFALLAVLMLSSIAMAQDVPGSSPQNPLIPDGTWVEMPALNQHWYVIHDEGDDEAIEVKLRTVPNGAVELEVWTPEQLRAWALEEEFDPVGMATLSCGCELDDSVGKFDWRGSFLGETDFYLIAKSKDDAPSYYTLEVIGEDVTFPTGVSLAAEPAPVAASIAQPVAAVLQDHAAESPAYALPISEELTEIADEQMHWYGFRYDQDEEYEAMEVRVYAQPEGSVVATLRNMQQAQKWEQDGSNFHFGCCTEAYKDVAEEEIEAFMRWMSDDLASGEYFLTLELAEDFEGPATYRLEVLGEGISPS